MKNMARVVQSFGVLALLCGCATQQPPVKQQVEQSVPPSTEEGPVTGESESSPVGKTNASLPPPNPAPPIVSVPSTTQDGPLTDERERVALAEDKSANDDSGTPLTYSIVNSDILPSIKRSLDVRLSRKVPLDVLRSIAFKLKAQDPRAYERTFICYYLPGMEVGSGAWAISHFNPDLEVRILGVTIEQERMLRGKADDPSRKVFGRWLDEGMKGRITFFRQDGRLFMERLWADGSSGTEEIVEKSSHRGRVFQAAKGGGDAEEFYLIDNQGNLQLWDRDGLICTAKKMD